MRKSLLVFSVLAVLAGCATLAVRELDERYGQPDPTRYDTPAAPLAGLSYRADVQPILERRCVVCHGCYDAPCQLKLTAWEGIARGSSAELVYDATRLTEAPTTRLFVDAERASQWRLKGFAPVLNERADTPQANLTASVLYRSLVLKRDHPLPTGAVLPPSFDFALDRAQTCPRIENFDAYAQQFPLAGMPYGLSGLSAAELTTLTRWLEAGAPFEGDPPLPAAVQQQVQVWEALLNGDSAKERLMSRYLYEHLFLAHLSFDADPERRAFRLVRSRTAPGTPVAQIATRRPYDDPGVARVYYRLAPERETRVAKTHMPYALNPARMQKLRAWFLTPAYTVTAQPGYDPQTASNPFASFRELPLDGRYRFLLDEAQFIVGNFIKGPVCRGQMALDVIEDHFWVFFVDPASNAAEAELLLRQTEELRLPAAWGSNAPLLAWLEYSGREQKFLRAKNEFLQHALAPPAKLDLNLIWDGDGRNRNAALTVFRHYDSASVVQGLVGAPPKTAWVIDYSLLERIFYLLVAGYDVYGNLGHQAESRLYMDFLRMEGETNFLLLLPQARRHPTAEFWYRGAEAQVREYMFGRNQGLRRDSDIRYRSDDPQNELYGLLRQRLAPVIATNFDPATLSDAGLRRDLQALAALRGASLSWLPEVVVLRIDEGGQTPRYFSLLRNTGHANVAHVFDEQRELRPDENTLTVAVGFIGAYPNAIYRIDRAALPAFTQAVQGLASEADYRALTDRYAVRRTDPGFWAVSDALLAAHARTLPGGAGVLDYGRLENR